MTSLAKTYFFPAKLFASPVFTMEKKFFHHLPKTCQPWSYIYLRSRRASPPFGRYQIILLGDRGSLVLATCPVLLPDDAPARSRTRNLCDMLNVKCENDYSVQNDK